MPISFLLILTSSKDLFVIIEYIKFSSIFSIGSIPNVLNSKNCLLVLSLLDKLIIK